MSRRGGARSPQRELLRGHAALLGVQLCFGLFPIFGKWAFEDFSPFAVACWRIGFGALSIGGVALALHGRRLRVGAGDLARLCLLSVLGITANQVLYLAGLSRSTAVNAGLLMCLIPVFTFLTAVVVRQERFGLARGLGVLLALAGAAWWFVGERPDLVRAHGFGNLLMALNSLCYSVYLVLARPLVRRHPPVVVLAWVYVLALPALPFLANGEGLLPAHAGARAWWSLAFVLVFPTSLGYFLNVFALARVRASTTAVYVYLQPVFTALAGVSLLGEELTPALLVTGAFVFAGIWLVARKPPASGGEGRALLGGSEKR